MRPDDKNGRPLSWTAHRRRRAGKTLAAQNFTLPTPPELHTIAGFLLRPSLLFLPLPLPPAMESTEEIPQTNPKVARDLPIQVVDPEGMKLANVHYKIHVHPTMLGVSVASLLEPIPRYI